MTVKDVVRLFKNNEPSTVVEARQLGLRFRLIGSGAFRNTYSVTGVKLVVKFPRTEKRTYDYLNNIQHTKNEIIAVNRIKRFKKYAKIKQYLPEVYYSDRKNGVILMKKYDHICSYEDYCMDDVTIQRIENKVDKLFPNSCTDLHWKNFGKEKLPNGKTKYVIIDLGLFYD